MSKQPNYSEYQSQLQVYFGQVAQQLGYHSGAVQRERRLTASHLALILILGWLETPQASLNQLSQYARRYGVAVSSQALHSRLTAKTITFLQGLLQHSLSQWQGQALVGVSVLKHFKAIYLIDSSYIQLKASFAACFRGSRGQPSGLKCYLCWDYLSGVIQAIEVTAGCHPDQNSPLPLDWAQAGSLLLFDLGFFNQRLLQALDQAHAYFITRLQSQVALYDPQTGQRFDLLRYLQHLPTCSSAQVLPLLLGRTAQLPIWVVLQRLDEQAVQQRQQRDLKKAQQGGQRPSARHQALRQWSLYVTNIPPTLLPPHTIITLYRLRWQVELLFKFAKSLLALDQLDYSRPERVLCQFYARLIGLCLFHWLTAHTRAPLDPQRHLSYPKAFQVLQNHLPAFAQALARSRRFWQHFFRRLVREWLDFALTSSRRKSPSTLQLLTSP